MPAEPRPAGRRLRRGAAGALVSAALLGGPDVDASVTEGTAVVVDWSGDPPFADPVLLRLDPERPDDSIAFVPGPPLLTAP